MKSAVKKATNVLNQLLRQRDNWLSETAKDQGDLVGLLKMKDAIQERYDNDMESIDAKINLKKSELVDENKVELEKYQELIASARVSLETAKGKN